MQILKAVKTFKQSTSPRLSTTVNLTGIAGEVKNN